MLFRSERCITLDCDVIQADGGTRTASITGACVALSDAINSLLQAGTLKENPVRNLVASVSVGIYQGVPVLDLDYAEDSNAETDMNVVMDDKGHFIELQGTAEGKTFSMEEMLAMTELARNGIADIIRAQKLVLGTDA